MTTTTTTTTTAWITAATIALGLAAAPLLTACKSKEEKAFEAMMEEEEKERDQRDKLEASRKPITAEAFGKAAATPLPPLSKLTLGMPIAEARKAAPELFDDDDDSYWTTDSPAWKETYYGVGADYDTKSKVVRTTIGFPLADKATLLAAWGPGIDGKDTIDRPLIYWHSPATGIRAVLETTVADNLSLEFTAYLPVDKLLGDGKDKLGFEPQSSLGATLDEIKTRFAAYATPDKDKPGEVDIELLPSEYGQFSTPVYFSYDEQGKVKSLRFGVEYGPVSGARDQILAAVKKKWGEPKEVEEYGTKHLQFNESPLVEVEDSPIMKEWSVTVSLPEK